MRGTLAKKRQSQFSERKAQREHDKYTLQHQMAIKDFNDAELMKNKNSLGLAKKQNQQMMNKI